MAKRREFDVTVDEGQQLLLTSSNFMLPEKLGETQYTPIERAVAAEDVRCLYRELRSRSPKMHVADRLPLFGPGDNYAPFKSDDGRTGHKMIDPKLKVTLALSEEAESGLTWTILSALHPGSPFIQPISVQEEIFWPLAERLGRLQAIRQELGLHKANPRKWMADNGNGDAATKEETKKLEAPK